MKNQLGLSELVISQLGTEKQIMSGDEYIFHFTMRVDELEEIIELGDIAALVWLTTNFNDEGLGLFLSDMCEAYMKAVEIFEETGQIEGIEIHTLDGMQYVYCYEKNLPITEKTRKDAVEFFINEPNKAILGRLIVAFGIRFLIVGMLEQKLI